MGTNYYFITKNRHLAHEHFASPVTYGDEIEEYIDEEYGLRDVPDFHYVIHLNKLSWGWRPLFQKHKCFETFSALEKFYQEHKDDLIIRDEYGEEFAWDDYKEIILNHASRTPQPMKWVYEEEKFWSEKFGDHKKRLHTVECEPEEADLFIPFNHKEYGRTEREAQKRFKAYNVYVSMNERDYTNDPDYPIDWVSGEFS